MRQLLDTRARGDVDMLRKDGERLIEGRPRDTLREATGVLVGALLGAICWAMAIVISLIV